MDNNVTQTIINSLITWVLQPETITALIGIILYLPKWIKLFKRAKKEEYTNLAYELGKEICTKLIFEPLENEEKRNVAIKWVYMKLPKNAEKYLSEQDMIAIINSAYHTHSKPESVK